MKRIKKKCKPSFSDTCLSKINAKCVDFEGILSEYSELDSDDCLNVEEVIEDIGNNIDDIHSAIDVSELGCCIQYTPSDEEVGLVIKDVVSTHEGIICDLQEAVETLKENCAGDCKGDGGLDDCGNPISTKDVFLGYGSGNISINFPNFTPISNTNYSDLSATVYRKGLYKVTLDIESTNVSGSCLVGISINGLPPLATQFNQSKFEPPYTSKTLHFVVDLLKDDKIKIVWKHNLGFNIPIQSVKMLVNRL